MTDVLEVEVPGQGLLQLEHLVLDLNGTIAVDGALLEGVTEAIRSLAALLHVVLVTADTHGRADAVAAALGCDLHLIGRGSEAEAKLDLVDELGCDSVVAIGHGGNDGLMLADAALGIAVIGREGAARVCLDGADIVVTSIDDALGMLLDPRRLIATMRR